MTRLRLRHAVRRHVDKAIKTAGNIGESCFEMILFRMTDFEIKARQKTPREREGGLQAELDSDVGSAAHAALKKRADKTNGVADWRARP